MTKPTGRPRGAPPLPPDRKRGVRIEVRATPAELAEIDRRREQDAAATATEPDTRSDWLLRAAGVRPLRGPSFDYDVLVVDGVPVSVAVRRTAKPKDPKP